jgi:hypothetical protein
LGREERPEQHSRIFAHQREPALPNPPTGSLAGGPNVELRDPSAGGLQADVLLSRPHRLMVDERDGHQLPPETTTCAAMASASLAAGPVSRL